MRYQDINLTREKMAEAIRFSDSTPWLIRRLKAEQVHAYVDQELEPFNSTSRQAGNCFVIGSCHYRRKDGKPITQNDLDALNELDYGQCNRVTGKVGDPSALHYYECDSGD